MSSAKSVQIELDRPRNWRFTTGARIRLCDRLNVPDGLRVVLEVLGKPSDPEASDQEKAAEEQERLDRLKAKDSHLKLAALVWCGQIQTEDPLSFEALLEELDDATIVRALPMMVEAINASMGNPTSAPADQSLAQEMAAVAT